MLFTTILLPLFSVAATAELIPALQPRAPSTHLDTRQSSNPLLGKRQFCDANYPYICSAIDGDAMCMAASEVCCQRIATDGTFPYTCPMTHPYCCPSDSAGNPQCGSDSSCAGGNNDLAPTHGLATQSSGVAPTKKTAAAASTRTAGGGGVAAKPTGSAERIVLDGGVLVAAVLGGLAML
ncbi:hypothetical protein BCR34DRAFT_604951 [Clohesyomyces aquaticus]|uniref:Uncharacterized protein n=1 Tax=Clohesyomyces aquaticus TaxID=1231657 RepID=A0A1Y1Z2X9_9PLEO|nr:hypothetical protein BCR34DRAFT_604951 [Clohesyomyces aquaticus]